MAANALSYMMQPEDYRQKLALMLAQNAFDTSPKQSWAQGASQLAHALLAGSMMKDLGDEQTKGVEALMNAPGLGGTAATAPNPAAVSPGATPTGPRFGDAISGIESGGRYDALGPVTPTGDRAFGKYQIMGNNIPQWTKTHLGQEMTPDQFLANPQAQDAVFQGQFGQYAQKYGPEGAARAWFAGEGGMNDLGRKDQLGTTVGQYGQKFAQAAGVAPGAVPPGAVPPQSVPGAVPVPQTQTNPQPLGGQTLPQTPQARTAVNIPPEEQDYIKRLLANPTTLAAGFERLNKFSGPTDQWQPVLGRNGQIIGQMSSLTREVKPYPQGPESQSDVGDARSNWQSYGLPNPNSTDPKDQSWWKEFVAKRLGGAGTNVSIDQRASSKFEDTYGEGMGKIALGTVEAGNAAPEKIATIRLMKSMNNAIQTGALTPAQATIGGYMQSVGLDPKAIGIDPNLPATVQSMTALANKQTLGMIGSGGMPANNFSDADRKFLSQIQSGPSDRPEANALKLEVAERTAQLAAEKADKWAEARGAGLSYEKFDQGWRKEMAGRNVFGDISQQFNSQPGANPKSVVPSQGTIRKYNPATGRIE